MLLPYFTFDFTVERPGSTATLDAQATCCVPTVRRRPARATLKGRRNSPQNTTKNSSQSFRVQPIAHPPRAARPVTPKGRKSKTLSPATNLAPFFRVRAATSGPGIKDAPSQARRPNGLQKHRIHSPPLSVAFVLGAPPSRRYCVALAEDSDLKVATIPAPAPTNSVGFRQRRPARASRMPRRKPGGS